MQSFDPVAAAAATTAEEEAERQRRLRQEAAAVRQRAKAGAGVRGAPRQQQQQQKGGQGPADGQLLDEDGTDISEFLVPAESAVGGKRTGGASSCSGSDDDAAAADGRRRAGPAGPLPPARKPQVIFCSRTHSQLSQFVGELRRTRFAESLKLVAVGSRRALCVNEAVSKLSDLAAINERCMELQQSKGRSGSSKSRRGGGRGGDGGSGGGLPGLAGLARAAASKREARGGCPFLKRGGGPGGGAGGGGDALEEFKGLVLASPADVEDLARLGRSKQVRVTVGRVAGPGMGSGGSGVC
jgi:chromosome transmission fidelity protein 1